MELVLREAQNRGARLLLSPEPLDPSRISALLLPDCGLAFVDRGWELPGCQHIQLDTSPIHSSAPFTALLAQAMEKLKQAKALHDELEAVYKPYMDFPALDGFTVQQLQARILS